MTITGTIPSAIAAFLKTEDESTSGLEIKSNDIDVVFTDGGKYTELYAIGTGNGSYEIIEIEDNLNMFPQYDKGDIISNDVLKKVFSMAINSSLILSWNPLGKIKYGIVDTGKGAANKVSKIGNKIKETGKWIADIVSPEDAQNYIRSLRGFNRAKVGKVERIGGVTGGYYTVLFGNPADKTYYVWDIYRNGNEYRVLDGKNHSQYSSKDGNLALEEFNTRAGIYSEDPYEENNAGVVDEQNEEVEQTPEPEENNIIPEDGWVDAGDGFSYKVTSGIKNKIKSSIEDSDSDFGDDADKNGKKKKSKYNGCNVTGCVESDGTVALA